MSHVAGGPFDDGRGDDDVPIEPRAPTAFAASASEGGVTLTWSPPTRSVGLTGYALTRDGVALATASAATLEYVDRNVSFAAPTAPTITNALGQVEGIALSWTEPTGDIDGHMYAIAALYGSERSAEATAKVDAQSITYQVQRDGGEWVDVGGVTNYLDTDAPRFPIAFGPVHAVGDFRGVVVVRVESVSLASSAAIASYRVRARLGGLLGTVSDGAVGQRAPGDLNVMPLQWERSNGEIDGGYSAIPEVTGNLWFDEDAPVNALRWYRVRAGGWADGVSDAVSARVVSYDAVAAGGFVSCGIRDDGIDCWGYLEVGPSGQAGAFKQLAVGENHYCALRGDGSVACSGSPSAALAAPAGERFTQLRALHGVTCGIRTTDARVVCWGGPTWTPPPDALQTFAISTAHGCGLTGAGRAICWGDNAMAQASPPATLFKQVAVGEGFSCGISATDDLVCWGTMLGGNDMPAGKFVELSAAGATVCAIADKGELVCFGDTSSLPIMTDDLHT